MAKVNAKRAFRNLDDLAIYVRMVRFEPLAEAYYLLRDAGWREADYEAASSRSPTPCGQPCQLANFAANLAASPPPDATFDYGAVWRATRRRDDFAVR
jgi:hypothetical protein